MKILFAEDTRELSRAVSLLLAHEQYDVDCVYDGQEALDHVAVNAYDCILLDVMMPRLDGMSVLIEIRRRHITTPVIMLTAKGEVDDRVAGLDAGADDYLPKPFAMKELLARIRSATRRSTDYGVAVVNFEDVALDPKTFALSNKNSVHLSVKEYELMQALIGASPSAISTDNIIARVWKGDDAADQDTVWLYVSYLKGKLLAVGSSVTVAGTRGGSFQLIKVQRSAE